VAAKYRVIDRGWKSIQRELNEANSKVVAVGVLNGAEPHVGGATLGEVATWNHYGTSTIPARPFIVGPIDAKQTEIRSLIERLVKGISLGKVGADQALDLLGQKLRDTCVSAINAREFEPNAESTIARKGSSTPLVDTGQLKGSITFEVRDSGGEE
jgi:hypothetical protein